jgi:hypothetical protein
MLFRETISFFTGNEWNLASPFNGSYIHLNTSKNGGSCSPETIHFPAGKDKLLESLPFTKPTHD